MKITNMKAANTNLLRVIIALMLAFSASYSVSNENTSLLQSAAELRRIVTNGERSFSLLTLTVLLMDTHLAGIAGAPEKMDASTGLSDYPLDSFYQDVVASKTMGVILTALSDMGAIHESAYQGDFRQDNRATLAAHVNTVASIFAEMERTDVWGYGQEGTEVRRIASNLQAAWAALHADETRLLQHYQNIIDKYREMSVH